MNSANQSTEILLISKKMSIFAAKNNITKINKKTHTTMNYSTKKELAMAYCPDIDYTAALKKLNQWIRTNAELSARLAATGYIPTQRRFTPQQVRLLFHYLGEPF